MEQQQQAVRQFIAFATGIQVGSLYHGWHDNRIREDTQVTDPAGFVFGLALRESVSGNAIGNMLERADVFPTAKQQLQEPGSLMVTASTSLRDELLVLEGKNMLRGNGTSHWVEDTLAERGVMIPHAWEHMRARLTDRVQNMVRSFVREDKVFPEGTNIAPLERAVVAIVDRYVQQQCGIDQDEPSNGQDAATKARLLKTTDRAVLYGMAGDCSHDMSRSYGMPASTRFAKGRMVDMLTRTASRGPLAGEYELLSAPPGDHALTVVGAIRALLRPVDKSGAYTFRQFAEKMGTTEYFSMDGHSGKEFIGLSQFFDKYSISFS
jgi:hypothetical protein